MKKILSSVLAIIMLFAICSCGGAGTGGVNTPKGITIGGCVVEYEGFEFLEVDGEDVIAIDYTFTNNNEHATSFFSAFLYEAKQGEDYIYTKTVFLSEDSMEAMDDATFDEVAPGESLEVTLTYALSDKVTPVTMIFSELTSAVEKTHTIEIAEVEEVEEETEDDLPEVPQTGLLADTQWYGWWMVADATGEYEDYDGAYFDCCVAFEKTSDGYTLMSIWDETFPDYENECLGEVYFEEIDGNLVSVEGGYFFTGDSVKKEAVIIDPEFTDYENTLFTAIDVKDEDGSFVAAINLTQWGYEWNEDFTELPTYYDSYFLPMMEDGNALPKNIEDIG